jgi:hypothetical protein
VPRARVFQTPTITAIAAALIDDPSSIYLPRTPGTMPHTMSSNSRLANREAYRENRKAAKKKAAARSRAAKAKMKMARSLPQITEVLHHYISCMPKGRY